MNEQQKTSYSQGKNEITISQVDLAIPVGTATLEGTLLDKGVPLGNLPLIYTFGGYRKWVSGDESGHFRFEELPPGPLLIEMLVGNPDNPLEPTFRAIDEVEIGAGAEVHLDIEIGDLD